MICFVCPSRQQGESSLGNLCFSRLACLSGHPPCRVIKSGAEIRQARKKLQWHRDSTCSGLAEVSPVKSLHTRELSLGTHKSKSLLHIGDSSQGGALSGALGLGCKLELETQAKENPTCVQVMAFQLLSPQHLPSTATGGHGSYDIHWLGFCLGTADF